MSKTICIYHIKDLDGQCSAAIVKKWWEEMPEMKATTDTIEFIGFDYGRPLPDLSKADKIIMCDISFPEETMHDLARILGPNFIWLDHHISAINGVEKYFTEKGDVKINGLRDHTMAACEITWRFLFPDKAMPQAVRMLGEYDSWRGKDMVRWDQIIMPFQWGMRLLCNSFETFPMRLLNEPREDCLKEIYKILEEGVLFLRYQTQSNEGLCRLTFAKEFKGLRAICLNAIGTGSQTFKSVWDPKRYDIMITFYYNGHHDFFTVSLYSDKPEVDCSVIAKSLGGGGHKGAAGFQVKDFREIWEK